MLFWLFVIIGLLITDVGQAVLAAIGSVILTILGSILASPLVILLFAIAYKVGG